MLTATRDDGPHAHTVPYGPPRTLGARFTSGIQLVGSLVGIPLALIGGYSTYHASFSPEGQCRALRANIVSMLDKKTDATTLRLLVQKDVVTFERECGAVDADAAAAFRTLLVANKAPAAQAEKMENTEKVEKREPVRREAAKRAAPATRDAPAKEAVVKLEVPKQLGAPPQPLVAPPPAENVEAATPVQSVAVQPGRASVDATWVASVRDALRESASQQPAAETASDVAAPINIAPEPPLAGAPVPPADVGPAPRAWTLRPPAPIPDAN